MSSNQNILQEEAINLLKELIATPSYSKKEDQTAGIIGKFLALKNIPASRELLYRSVLNRADKKILVGHNDSLYLSSITSHKIDENGKSISIKLIELFVGFGLPPEFIWVDEHDNYFADVSFFGWRQHIKKGYEIWVDTLVKWQEEQSLIYFGKEFTTLSKPLYPTLAITNVRVFDAISASITNNKTVLIENGLIKEIGEFGKIKIPDGYEIISGDGKTMLPGFWDMHAHYTLSLIHISEPTRPY